MTCFLEKSGRVLNRKCVRRSKLAGRAARLRVSTSGSAVPLENDESHPAEPQFFEKRERAGDHKNFLANPRRDFQRIHAALHEQHSDDRGRA